MGVTDERIYRNPCPQCGGESVPRNWQPPPGLDASLVKFSCRRCHTDWYRRVPNLTSRKWHLISAGQAAQLEAKRTYRARRGSE